jgi:hypothetical protein
LKVVGAPKKAEEEKEEEIEVDKNCVFSDIVCTSLAETERERGQ